MKTILAELLTIGDEILYGQIVDTNSQWMSIALSNAGIKVIRKTTVGDQEDEILNAFMEAEKRADIVLITGGLGPTSDDLTKPCLARYFDCGLKIHEEALAEVTEFFKSRGRELTEVNRQQAALPVCCEKITNRLGTAPAMWFDRNGKVFVSMPGVPHEMKTIMTEIVIPKLRQRFSPPAIHHRVIRTAGLGESMLAEKIADWENNLPPNIRLAYLPGLGEVRLRLTAIGESLPDMEKETAMLTEKLKERVGQYIYGYGEDPLEVVIGNLLRQKKITLAVAESCTGGYLSHLITSVPGSSDYFLGGVIPYSNELKIAQLGVSPASLAEHGAVSEPVVLEMARLVRKQFHADIGVATSGIAGPGGGTAEKPVGTVWIAYADKDQTVARKLQLSKDRMVNIKASTVAVLNLLRLTLPK
jgi:nicotinamide-nucleotide amidase